MNEVATKSRSARRLVSKAWDLEVYQRAFRVAMELHQVSLEFPKIEQFALSSQIRRSSKSICANIAEGFPKQKYSKPEFNRYLSMAEASANETIVWLQFAYELGYITPTKYQEWANAYEYIASMLFKLRAKTS